MGLNSVHAFIQTHTRAPTLSLALSSHIQISSAHMTANILPAGPFHTLWSTVSSLFTSQWLLFFGTVAWLENLPGN